MKVKFNIGPQGHRRLGHVIRMNNKTVVVKIMKGAKSFKIIKRHIRKHEVWPYGANLIMNSKEVL
jgi:hypothetical protein